MSGTSLGLRLATALLLFGAAGWAGYTLYERHGSASAEVAAAPADESQPRLGALLDEGYQALTRGDLDRGREAFVKASALAPEDDRVVEGRILAAVLEADAAWRRWRYAASGSERTEALETLDERVDDARTQMAEARQQSLGPGVRARLAFHERRLNTLVVGAFAESGRLERASGALAARLEDTPEARDLSQYLRRQDGGDDGGDGQEQDGDGQEQDGDDGQEQDGGTRAEPTPRTPAPPRPQDAHFELESEPTALPTVEGELELPADAR